MKLIEIQRPTRSALLEEFKHNDTGYLTEDLISIVFSHFDDHWQPLYENGNETVIATCNLFNETLVDKSKTYADLKKAVEDFIQAKKANPLAAYGKSDTRFITQGNLAGYVPKLAHAHVTQDLSIFYTLDGSNPRVIKLYGVFSHADSGTGNTPNMKRQVSLGKRMAGQTFTIQPNTDRAPKTAEPAQNNKKKPKR